MTKAIWTFYFCVCFGRCLCYKLLCGWNDHGEIMRQWIPGHSSVKAPLSPLIWHLDWKRKNDYKWHPSFICGLFVSLGLVCMSLWLICNSMWSILHLFVFFCNSVVALHFLYLSVYFVALFGRLESSFWSWIVSLESDCISMWWFCIS